MRNLNKLSNKNIFPTLNFILSDIFKIIHTKINSRVNLCHIRHSALTFLVEFRVESGPGFIMHCGPCVVRCTSKLRPGPDMNNGFDEICRGRRASLTKLRFLKGLFTARNRVFVSARCTKEVGAHNTEQRKYRAISK